MFNNYDKIYCRIEVVMNILCIGESKYNIDLLVEKIKPITLKQNIF